MITSLPKIKSIEFNEETKSYKVLFDDFHVYMTFQNDKLKDATVQIYDWVAERISDNGFQLDESGIENLIKRYPFNSQFPEFSQDELDLVFKYAFSLCTSAGNQFSYEHSSISSTSLSKERVIEYKYTVNGKTKIVKRKYKNIGLKKAKRDELEEFIRNIQNINLVTNIKKYHEEFNKDAKIPISYTMFYNEFIKEKYKVN